MARFTKSAILYQQMRGRGARKGVKVKKPIFTIFDFVGVTDFHGDNEDYPDGGFVVQQKPKQGPDEPRRLLVLDVNDHIDPTTRGWITIDEDGNEIRTEAAAARAEELRMRFEAWLLERNLNSEQHRLMAMVGEQIQANALVYDSFELFRFVEPPFSHNGGIDRTTALFGSMEALEAVLDDLNRAVFQQNANTEAAPAPGMERSAGAH
jgi:type I restriction enzyme R subunit